MKLNKLDIVKKMVDEGHFRSQAKAAKALAAIVETISEEVMNQNEVTISGFGVFKNIVKKETVIRHPVTKELMTVPSKRVAKFAPSKTLIIRNV